MKSLPLILFFTLPFFAKAGSNVASVDTVINGKIYSTHTVAPKETWYSISRQYDITVEELQLANKGTDVLKINHKVILPVKRGAGLYMDVTKQRLKVREMMEPQADPSKISGFHVVEKGETAYSIAKKYGASVEELVAWNNLKSPDLKIGDVIAVNLKAAYQYRQIDRLNQVLENDPRKPENAGKPRVLPPDENAIASRQIGPIPGKTGSTSSAVTPSRTTTQAEDDFGTVHNSAFANPDTAHRNPNEIFEKGAASWIDDEDINPNKFYALHRSAPIGTMIKVTNIMNSTSVFVKVVGRLPDSGDNNRLIIKISKAAAKKLEVSDPRFQAELTYGK